MEYKVLLMDGVEDFIRNLIPKLEAKALRTLQMLKSCGYELKEPHAKTLKNAEGLKELRVQAGNDICRLFYFHFQGCYLRCYIGLCEKTAKNRQK